MPNPGSLFPPNLLKTEWIDSRTGQIHLAWQKWLQNLGQQGSQGAPQFADGVTPNGIIDGVNPTFSLPATPNPVSSLQLFKNGQKLSPGAGFTLAGNVITYAAGYIPQPGDVHEAFFRH